MNRIKTLFITVSLTLITVAATSWLPTTGSVKFYIKNAGITVDGSLSGISAAVKFDATDLANSSIYASVKVNTINTGIDKRDEHLKSKEYFDAANHPKIVMRSKSFTKTAKGFTGVFDMTIRGKTKQLNVPFTFENNGKTGTFKGSLKLDRLDFGVGKSSFVLSDDVKVNIKLNVKQN